MRALLFVPLLFAAFLASAPAHSEKPVALVIGTYESVQEGLASISWKDERDQGIADLRRSCEFRSWSIASLWLCADDFRSLPGSGHSQRPSACLKGARKRLMHCSKQRRFVSVSYTHLRAHET